MENDGFTQGNKTPRERERDGEELGWQKPIMSVFRAISKGFIRVKRAVGFKQHCWIKAKAILKGFNGMY